jgi:hypothetical protein
VDRSFVGCDYINRMLIRAIIARCLFFLLRPFPCYEIQCHPDDFDHTPPFILVSSFGIGTHPLIFSEVAFQLLRRVTESL